MTDASVQQFYLLAQNTLKRSFMVLSASAFKKIDKFYTCLKLHQILCAIKIDHYI